MVCGCKLLAMIFFHLSELLLEAQLLHPELLGQALFMLLLQLVELLHFHHLLPYVRLVI